MWSSTIAAPCRSKVRSLEVFGAGSPPKPACFEIIFLSKFVITENCFQCLALANVSVLAAPCTINFVQLPILKLMFMLSLNNVFIVKLILTEVCTFQNEMIKVTLAMEIFECQV